MLVSVRQHDQDGGLRRDALAAAGETEPLGGGGLDGNQIRWRNAEQFGQSGAHGRGVRGDFRALADQGDIGIGETAAAGGDAFGRRAAGNEHYRRLSSVFARREMPADIAFGQSAVNSVA